jgi:hypothetical protein
MLFKKKSYELIGGHEEVKNDAVDGFSLLRQAKNNKLKWKLLNGINVLSCRMYNGFKEVFKGFSRLLFPAFENSAFQYCWVWLWIGLMIYSPLIYLNNNLFIYSLIPFSITILSIMITLIYLRFPIHNVLFVPFTYLVLLTIAFFSMIKTILNINYWKGRKLRKQRVKFI